MGQVTQGGITTHVLDTSRGGPAAGVGVRLEHRQGQSWIALGQSRTDADGRCRDLLRPPDRLEGGRYRLVFDTGAYFSSLALAAFFPEVTVDFAVADPGSSHHVPLLLAPHGYTTYRGS